MSGVETAARVLTAGMADFLQRHLFLTLATHNPDRSLHVVPVCYLFDGGRFYVATSSSTRKARNLATRPDVTVTVDDRGAIGWISATGRAELIRGSESRAVNKRLYRRWMTDEGLDVVGRVLHDIEDVTIVITPRSWLAWDMASMFFPALEEAGIPLDRPERWFLA